MKLTALTIKGAYLINLNPIKDDRGSFMRLWCQKTLADLDIDSRFVQTNISLNAKKGTLRGLHYQHAPYQEAKLIHCFHGKLYDVFVDLRPTSATYKKHLAIELDSTNPQALLIPEGCAHGFQTLADNTDLIYGVSNFYHPESEAGIRWNDPSFAINWPLPVTQLSAKDRHYPDWHKDDQ